VRGMSDRNFRRLCVLYEEDGIEGLRDRRIASDPWATLRLTARIVCLKPSIGSIPLVLLSQHRPRMKRRAKIAFFDSNDPKAASRVRWTRPSRYR
jgi:hypothetical protein